MLQPTSSNSSELRGSAGISIPLSHYFHQQDLHSSDSTNVHTGAPALPQHVGLRGLAATCSAPAGPAATSKVDQPTAGRFSGGPSALHAMKLLLWSWIHCTIDEKVLRPQLWYQSQLQSAVSSGSASTNSTGSSKRRKPTEFDATVKQLRKRLSSDVHAQHDWTRQQHCAMPARFCAACICSPEGKLGLQNMRFARVEPVMVQLGLGLGPGLV